MDLNTGARADSGHRPQSRPVDEGRRTSLALALRGLIAVSVILSAVVRLQLWAAGMRNADIQRG